MKIIFAQIEVGLQKNKFCLNGSWIVDKISSLTGSAIDGKNSCSNSSWINEK